MALDTFSQVNVVSAVPLFSGSYSQS